MHKYHSGVNDAILLYTVKVKLHFIVIKLLLVPRSSSGPRLSFKCSGIESVHFTVLHVISFLFPTFLPILLQNKGLI